VKDNNLPIKEKHVNSHTNDEEFVSIIIERWERSPFHKVLGLKVESVGPDFVKTLFEMQDELKGHYKRGMLHGGVISSVIDATGGLEATMSIQKTMHGETLEAKLEKARRMSTIDLGVNYLRPGVGSRFIATANTLRTGNTIVVSKIELYNDQNDLIAVGTGSYILGG
jgi:uncharacterized protein (TIGR00369 family)